MERRFHSQGKKFLAALLYFDNEAKINGKRVRVGKVIRAFYSGELERFHIRVIIK